VSLNLLKDYALINEVAADLGMHPRTVRRKLHEPNSRWSYVIVGGKIRLHIPTIREIIAAETKTNNPTRQIRRRKVKGGTNGATAA
jgi:hypothetical protein